MKLFVLVAVLGLSLNLSNGLSNYKFPTSVKFGGATAAYLVEGAAQIDGKGLSLWDNISYAFPSVISGTVKVADVAADQYHRYAEDVALAASLGHNFYKFSISWPRILPNGTVASLNQKGLNYYNNLINAIISHGMEAHVVMFNFDIPWELEKQGGFVNENIVKWFSDYANILYSNFGDRVKTWITINEAHAYCKLIPDNILFSVLKQNLGFKEYQCAHNLLKAHAAAYRLYESNYKCTQNGKVGMAFSMYWYYPATSSAADKAAAVRARNFVFEWFANPIFKGDYPQILKSQLANLSALEGRNQSRLPTFTSQEIANIKGTADFLGLNAFKASNAAAVSNSPLLAPSVQNDTRCVESINSTFDTSGAYVSKPEAFRSSIKYASTFCNNCSIYLTEHGWGSTNGTLNDTSRITFFQNYLDQILLAIHVDHVNISNYAVWQFMDGFYFNSGLTLKFGLINVDYSSANLTRTPRQSAYYFKSIIESRSLTNFSQSN